MNIDKIKKDFEEEFCYLDETNDESGHYETIDLIDTNPVELWNFIESALKEQESQIKQSILKAIMEEARKQYHCVFCNNTGKIWSDFVGNYVPCNTEHDCEEDKVVAIESVIKEVLK